MSDRPASGLPKLVAQRPRAVDESTHFAFDVEPLLGCRRLSTRHRLGAGTARRAELQAAVVPPVDGSP